MKFEKIVQISSIALLTGIALTGAFSIKSKRKMYQRAALNQLGVIVDEKHAWQEPVGSELSGEKGRALEAMHFNHKKESAHYDDPDYGILVTIPEHLGHHLYFRNMPQKIGLNIGENNFAINELRKRVRTENEELGITESLTSIEQREVRKWEAYFAVEA